MEKKGQDRYRYKLLLEELDGIKGRGTELISVYITSGFELSHVSQQLREEKGTAENIKSKTTRKNVISALNRAVNFLQRYSKDRKKAPKNGLAIFAGNVSSEEGSSDIKLYWVEPPQPVRTHIYRCDQEFLLDPLKEALKPRETVGLVVLDSKEATVATLKGKRLNIAKRLTSGVWGKHSKGGQSAQRFERLREIAIDDFIKRIVEVANREFSGLSDLRAILVGGPGPIKERFLKNDLLRNELREKIATVIDLGYSNEQGIKELVNEAEDVLSDLEVMREKSLVQDFLFGAVSKEGMATYGEPEVRKHLVQGAVDTLMISDDLNLSLVKGECGVCGFEFQETVSHPRGFKKEVSVAQCPKCGEGRLEIQETIDEIQRFCELADKTGAKVEFISSETEEGRQFLSAFKGVGALLRYELS